jgi:hypothetical protein
MHFVPDISLMREDLNDVQVIDMEFYPPDDTGFQTHQVPERILVLFGNGETLEVRGANLWRFLDEIPERLRAEDGWYVRRHYFPRATSRRRFWFGGCFTRSLRSSKGITRSSLPGTDQGLLRFRP